MMRNLILKENYQSKLDLIETEVAIKFIKDNFEKYLASELNLIRISAPLFVTNDSGLNDHLNGVERPVAFDILNLDKKAEIVQSLAKWKRYALKKYHFDINMGIYTDMNAIRRDEELDSLHSIYVDQWDWEKVIRKEDRNFEFLKTTVKKIYQALLKVETLLLEKYPMLNRKLASEITFISSSELETLYPNCTSKERENLICQKYGSVFIYQIGWPLKDGLPHDLRASDYDDWNLNGDIFVWYDELKIALELSSMGIRVDKDSLVKQVTFKNEVGKLSNPYSLSVLNEELPFTIGGGIGQSRICMFFLEKAHIGEVQASLWSDEDIELLKKYHINLL